MALPAWDEITSHEKWQGLTFKQKRRIFQAYKRKMGRHDDWKGLTGQEKFNVNRGMEESAGFYQEEEKPGLFDEFTALENIKEFYPAAVKGIPSPTITTEKALPVPAPPSFPLEAGALPMAPRIAEQPPQAVAPQPPPMISPQLQQQPVKPIPGPVVQEGPLPPQQIGQPPSPETSPLATVPYLTLRALRGLTHPLFAPLAGTGIDTNALIEEAIRYWGERTPEMGAIPDIGIGPKGLERRETPIKELVGGTAEAGGAIAGPVKAAFKAGGLITELPQIMAKARPFYRSIMRGMIAGSLVGEGDPEQTLQDMALFGIFEPVAYGIGKVPEVPGMIRDSATWRSMKVKERGLILQSLDDTIQKNPNISEGEILRKWDNPKWREEAIERYVAPIKKEVRPIKPEAEVKPTIEEKLQAIDRAAKIEKEQIRRKYEAEKAKLAEEVVPPKVEPEPEAVKPEVVEPEAPKPIPTAKPPEVAEIPPEKKPIPLPVKAKVEEVAKPIPEAKEVKEVWEMDAKEWTNQQAIEDANQFYVAEPKKRETQIKRLKFIRNQAISLLPRHKEAVQQAIEEGKITSHPDYPELGKVEKAPPKPTGFQQLIPPKVGGEYFNLNPESGKVAFLVPFKPSVAGEKVDPRYEAKPFTGNIADLEIHFSKLPKSIQVAYSKWRKDFAKKNLDKYNELINQEPTIKRPVKPEPKKPPEIEIIPSSKALDIRNMEAMPRGTGARYLEVIRGEKGEYIAKQWRRKPTEKGILVDFGEKAKAPKAIKDRSFVYDLIDEGGLWDPSLPGEIKDLMTGFTAAGKVKRAKGVPIGLLSKKTGRGVDGRVSDMVYRGYQIEDVDQFLRLLEQDIRAIAEKRPENRVRPTDYIDEAAEEAKFNEGLIEHERQKLRDQGYTEEQIKRAEKGIETEEVVSPEEKTDPDKAYEDLKDFFEEAPFELKPTEPSPEEKIAVGKERGEIVAPEKEKKKAVIPTEKIPVATKGEQVSLLPPQKGEQITLEGKIEEKAKPIPAKKVEPEIPSIPEKEKQAPLNTAKSLADTGGYATLKHHIIEMPEIVEIAHELMKGRYPAVKRKLRKRLALGLFRPTDIVGKIELKAEIFKNADEAAAILSHEIGHLVNWLPKKTLASGNILGRIASLSRYMKHTLPRAPGVPGELTQKDRQRLRNEATKIARAENKDRYIDEIIRKELPISPDDVLRIWNTVEDAKLINKGLYDYIARISTIEKKAIVKDALKGQVPAQLKQFAKVIEEKTGKKFKVQLYEEKIVEGKKVKVPTKEFKALIKKKYVDLINAEIKKRRLFHLDEVMDEIKALSRTWKPFDPSANPEYTKYRYSSTELYADTISAIINAPGLVRAQAPLFYEGFFNYLERKPEVKKLYYEIQDNTKSGEVEKKRTQGVYDMFRRGDEAYALSLEKDVLTSDLLKRDFIDLDHFILKPIKKIGEAHIPAGENPRYMLQRMRYTAAEVEWYAAEVLRNTIDVFEKQNFSWDDFGTELFLRRIAGERAEIANPRGWTPKLAEKKLASLKEDRTPEQNQAMQDAINAFRKTHEYVVEKAAKAERWDDDMIKIMRDTKEYATFDIVKYIEKRYGAAPSGQIYQQIGTLQETANPATATIVKDVVIIKATNRGIAAKSVTDFWQKHFPEEIRPAETKWNGKFHEIQEPDPKGKEGLIVYLHKGKPQGFYVNKYVADSFKSNPIEAQVITKILSATAKPFRSLFIDVNPGFWLFNLWRDYWRAVKMLPKAKITNFTADYMKGIKPAFRSAFGIPDEVVTEMLKGNELVSMADFRGRQPTDKTIEQILQRTHILPTRWNNRIIKQFGNMFNFYTNIGRAFERIPKVAGHEFLKRKFPEMDPEVRGALVRERAGSPAFLLRGRLYPFYNNILFFSNAMKEGYRGDARAFSDSPGEFMYKQAKYTYLPKLLMFAGVTGMLGYGIKAIFGKPEEEKDEIKDIFSGVSEYDKTNYIIIPLGLTESGKSVYFRLPTDETSRFMGGIFWKILNHQELGWGDLATGLFDYMAGQAPTLHPGIDILLDTIAYVSGRNPYDAFYGRYALPEDVFEAGGGRSHKEFLRYLADKSGANVVYRFKGDRIDQIQGELEKITRYPFLSNIVGRFIKVSDYGIREDLRRAKGEARKDNTRELLDAKDALVKFVNEEPLTDEEIKAILAKPDIIERNLMINLARKHGMIYLDEFIRASTNAEKAAVLKILLEKERLKTGSEDKKPIPLVPPAKMKPIPAPIIGVK